MAETTQSTEAQPFVVWRVIPRNMPITAGSRTPVAYLYAWDLSQAMDLIPSDWYSVMVSVGPHDITPAPSDMMTPSAFLRHIGQYMDHLGADLSELTPFPEIKLYCD